MQCGVLGFVPLSASRLPRTQLAYASSYPTQMEKSLKVSYFCFTHPLVWLDVSFLEGRFHIAGSNVKNPVCAPPPTVFLLLHTKAGTPGHVLLLACQPLYALCFVIFEDKFFTCSLIRGGLAVLTRLCFVV